jgi:hypothetical protein
MTKNEIEFYIESILSTTKHLDQHTRTKYLTDRLLIKKALRITPKEEVDNVEDVDLPKDPILPAQADILCGIDPTSYVDWINTAIYGSYFHTSNTPLTTLTNLSQQPSLTFLERIRGVFRS